MSSQAENITRLREIKEAQTAAEEVLYQYRKNPESMGNRLTSEQAMELYYQRYFYQRKGEMKYNVNVDGVSMGEDGANLVNLLSVNLMGVTEYRRNHEGRMPNRMMNQAFKTAGDLFEVIADKGKIDVVAEYYEEARTLIDDLSNPYLSVTEQKRLLRKLQLSLIHILTTLKNG